MAADQESLGGGEAKLHGLFMLLLELTRKTLSDVSQPAALLSPLLWVEAPTLSRDVGQREFRGSKAVNRSASQNRLSQEPCHDGPHSPSRPTRGGFGPSCTLDPLREL